MSGPDGDEPYTLFVNQTDYCNAPFLRTKVLVVSGGANSAPAAAITEISWKGLRCNLEVIAQHRTVVGGEAWAPKPGLVWSHQRSQTCQK